MPTSSQKPYRVYRQPRRVRGAADGTIQWDTLEAQHGTDGPRRPGAPRHVLRFLRRAIFVAVVLAVVWATIAFLSFRSAVKQSNARVPANVRAVLAPTNGPAIASSQVTLLVGADTSAHRKRTNDPPHADSMILMRVDPRSRTFSMLSIPRDLYVLVPGFGETKINEAYPDGGLALAVRTVQNFTGVDINHVMEIDFDGFREVIDAVGGVSVDNPVFLKSDPENPFDGQLWTFRKGTIELNGRNALAYARMRHTTNAEQSDDRQRALRQQRVLDALSKKIVSINSVRKPRGIPRAVLKPLITDMSASELLATGFGKFWSKSDNSLHCRLGGDNDERDGKSVLLPNEDNVAVVRMFLGKQPPAKPDSPVGAGCIPN